MGICSIKTISPESQLGIWHMTETWQELRELIDLPADELVPLDGSTKKKRKQEWLACRLLIREMLLIPPVVRHDEHRKPHVLSSSSEISMSHSGEYASVYTHKRLPVGVDIQQMKPSISKGIDYFLNADEQAWVNPDNNLLLHLIWSAKESAFKYAGDPELDLKKHFTATAFESNQNGEFEVVISTATRSETTRIQYETFADYVLTYTI